MPEFDPNGPYMQEGYWGKHSIGDECSLLRLITKPTSLMFAEIIRVYRVISTESRAGKLARDVLKVFFTTPNSEIIRHFSPGQTFIGADYPLGTIVEFEEEDLSLGFGTKTAHHTNKPYYL